MSVNDDQTPEMYYRPRTTPADGRDLENIVTLMELAAIELTTGPEATFSADVLYTMAQQYGGPTITLRRVDFDIVRDHASFLEQTAQGRWRLK